eukprot:TRINITY_DN824_c0_g1_i1.p1 TRINITY_DN824_c0_g1~~TRINITY_DN824_c0_g1_i1.p1  ORF type:complete len:272 (+),score=79.38 TRINITY_DN824_c0_g1_i1:579-1394(+)
MIRAFDDMQVSHVEGDVDPIRDLDIIANELRLKDIEILESYTAPIRRVARADPQYKNVMESLDKAAAHLESGLPIRVGNWTARDIEELNKVYLLTAKPAIYLVNLSTYDFQRQKNKWLSKVKNWIKENSPGSTMIPLSVSLEKYLYEASDEEQENYCNENNTRSMMKKVVQTGFRKLNLINFFTVGKDEVRSWVLRTGFTAPKAAGTIHGDFETHFIKAEVMGYDDFAEYGDEVSCKNAGKYRMEGKNYVVQDGDIVLFKHNAGGAGKKRK